MVKRGKQQVKDDDVTDDQVSTICVNSGGKGKRSELKVKLHHSCFFTNECLRSNRFVYLEQFPTQIKILLPKLSHFKVNGFSRLELLQLRYAFEIGMECEDIPEYLHPIYTALYRFTSDDDRSIIIDCDRPNFYYDEESVWEFLSTMINENSLKSREKSLVNELNGKKGKKRKEFILEIDEEDCCRLEGFIQINYDNNGKGLSLEIMSTVQTELSSVDRLKLAIRFLIEVYRETKGGNAIYTIGIVRQGAKFLPDIAEYFYDYFSYMNVNVMDLVEKQFHMVDYATHYDNMKRSFDGKNHSSGSMDNISMVGRFNEELGGCFSDYLFLMELSPFLLLSLPWGLFSKCDNMIPTDSNDGPIMWLRPGEQSVDLSEYSMLKNQQLKKPTRSTTITTTLLTTDIGGSAADSDGSEIIPKKRGRGRPKSVKGETKVTKKIGTTITGTKRRSVRMTRQRTIDYEDRTYPHIDHIIKKDAYGNEHFPCCAAGIIKATKFNSKNQMNPISNDLLIMKEVVVFDSTDFHNLINLMGMDCFVEPKNQCDWWPSTSNLNYLSHHRIRYSQCELYDSDIYYLPKKVIHSFKTTSACGSIAWHMDMKRIENYHTDMTNVAIDLFKTSDELEEAYGIRTRSGKSEIPLKKWNSNLDWLNDNIRLTDQDKMVHFNQSLQFNKSTEAIAENINQIHSSFNSLENRIRRALPLVIECSSPPSVVNCGKLMKKTSKKMKKISPKFSYYTKKERQWPKWNFLPQTDRTHIHTWLIVHKRVKRLKLTPLLESCHVFEKNKQIFVVSRCVSERVYSNVNECRKIHSTLIRFAKRSILHSTDAINRYQKMNKSCRMTILFNRKQIHLNKLMNNLYRGKVLGPDQFQLPINKNIYKLEAINDKSLFFDQLCLKSDIDTTALQPILMYLKRICKNLNFPKDIPESDSSPEPELKFLSKYSEGKTISLKKGAGSSDNDDVLSFRTSTEMLLKFTTDAALIAKNLAMANGENGRSLQNTPNQSKSDEIVAESSRNNNKIINSTNTSNNILLKELVDTFLVLHEVKCLDSYELFDPVVEEMKKFEKLTEKRAEIQETFVKKKFQGYDKSELVILLKILKQNLNREFEKRQKKIEEKSMEIEEELEIQEVQHENEKNEVMNSLRNSSMNGNEVDDGRDEEVKVERNKNQEKPRGYRYDDSDDSDYLPSTRKMERDRYRSPPDHKRRYSGHSLRHHSPKCRRSPSIYRVSRYQIESKERHRHLTKKYHRRSYSNRNYYDYTSHHQKYDEMSYSKFHNHRLQPYIRIPHHHDQHYYRYAYEKYHPYYRPHKNQRQSYSGDSLDDESNTLELDNRVIKSGNIDSIDIVDTITTSKQIDKEDNEEVNLEEKSTTNDLMTNKGNDDNDDNNDVDKKDKDFTENNEEKSPRRKSLIELDRFQEDVYDYYIEKELDADHAEKLLNEKNLVMQKKKENQKYLDESEVQYFYLHDHILKSDGHSPNNQTIDNHVRQSRDISLYYYSNIFLIDDENLKIFHGRFILVIRYVN
ncbi:hypothetical protein SNEBB_003781 [Seison nebaliae]|nr:hypothetical protein SNEBB_003781 [Seison nebaliae]